MEISVTTSSVLWPIILLLWIGLFVNTKYYKEIINHIIEKSHTLIIAWILWMIAWSYMVSNHNVLLWTPEIIISIIWWIMLLKSSFILALPSSFTKIVKKIKYSSKHLKLAWVIYITIWLYLVDYAYYSVIS